MRPLALSLAPWFLLLSLLVLQGCGGGGGGGGDTGDDDTGTEPQTRMETVVGLALTGGAESVGSVYLEVELPEGFELATDTRGDLAPGILSTDLPAAYIENIYLPASPTSDRRLRLGLICARGFTSERFITLLADIDSGETSPRAEEFRVVALTVSDLRGVKMSGYEVSFFVQEQEVAP